MLTALCPYRQLLSKCAPSIANGFDLIRTKEICANDRTRNESHSIGLGFIFCVAWMSYRFKHWLDEHVTQTQTSTGQPTRRRGTRAAKAIAASPPSRIRGVWVVQSVRDDPHRGTVGWFLAVGMERAAVCVCVSAGPGRDRSCQWDLLGIFFKLWSP